MSNYEHSNQGPGGISNLPPTIGSPARPYAPAYPAMPAMPQYPVMPAIPQYPARKGVLRGLAGLLGLGVDDGTSIWSRPWFPYAALGALGVGIYFLVRSKGREKVPTDVLFRNPFVGVGVGKREAGAEYDTLMDVVEGVRNDPTPENYEEAWNVIGDYAGKRKYSESAYLAGKELSKIREKTPTLEGTRIPIEAMKKLHPTLVKMGKAEFYQKPKKDAKRVEIGRKS
jgi:hypothetical protein